MHRRVLLKLLPLATFLGFIESTQVAVDKEPEYQNLPTLDFSNSRRNPQILNGEEIFAAAKWKQELETPTDPPLTQMSCIKKSEVNYQYVSIPQEYREVLAQLPYNNVLNHEAYGIIRVQERRPIDPKQAAILGHKIYFFSTQHTKFADNNIVGETTFYDDDES